MSSILKALKKIEEESPPPATFPSLPRPIDSKQALNSKTIERRRFRRTVIFVILLLVVVVAAFILYNQRRIIIAKILPSATTDDRTSREADSSGKNTVYRAKIRAASEKSVRLPSEENRKLKNQTKSAATDSSAKKFQTNKPSFTSAAAANQREPKSITLRPRAQSELNATAINPLKKPASLPGAAPIEKSVAQKKAKAPNEPTAATAKNPTGKRSSKVSYDRIEDSKLKLQALAWSEDDVRRMAVINGQIVREGQSVDGYQVVQIHEEYVVVNNGGKSWRLEFGLQQ
ncbi:MAG: general secretion pathway protein GspB [Desulfobacterales bacterium]|nr:MAG: general secretion pathway protein GspB [Desulfobacterales bacterium]